MRQRGAPWTDTQVEEVIGRLLRLGVLLAAAVVLLGAAFYLVQNGGARPAYGVFRGEPGTLETIPGIVRRAGSGDSQGVIQLGLLLLIATPVARVLFSVFAFARERDWLYVAITLVVLAVLGFSLVGGPR